MPWLSVSECTNFAYVGRDIVPTVPTDIVPIVPIVPIEIEITTSLPCLLWQWNDKMFYVNKTTYSVYDEMFIDIKQLILSTMRCFIHIKQLILSTMRCFIHIKQLTLSNCSNKLSIFNLFNQWINRHLTSVRVNQSIEQYGLIRAQRYCAFYKNCF